MTLSQLIHLAQVAGWKPEKYKISPSLSKKDDEEILVEGFIPHLPEGVAQFRELWLSLKEEHKQSVVKVYLNYINPRLKKIDITHVSRFTSWLFKKPEMACQIIFEVTGGKEK